VASGELPFGTEYIILKCGLPSLVVIIFIARSYAQRATRRRVWNPHANDDNE